MAEILDWLDSISLDALRLEVEDTIRQRDRLDAKLRFLHEAMEAKRAIGAIEPASQLAIPKEGEVSAAAAAGLPFPASGPPSARPRSVKAALELLFDEDTFRPWTVSELTKELESRGWLVGKQTGAVGVALTRMARNGDVLRLRKGTYVRDLAPREAPPVELSPPDSWGPPPQDLLDEA